MPPSLANAIAISDSEIVSIAADIIGILNFIFFEKRVFVETFPGNISEYAGTNNTSSNVNPSFNLL